MQRARRNRGSARTARNLKREILLPVGCIVRVGGLTHTQGQHLVSLGGQRFRIHCQEQSRAESAPYQAKCDCRGHASGQQRQGTRRDNAIGGHGSLSRQGDDRRGEALLVVLDQEPLRIEVLRHEIGARRIPCDRRPMIAQNVEVLRAVEQDGLRQCSKVNLRDLLLAGARHRDSRPCF